MATRRIAHRHCFGRASSAASEFRRRSRPAEAVAHVQFLDRQILRIVPKIPAAAADQ
jgi:hypothetical protein